MLRHWLLGLGMGLMLGSSVLRGDEGGRPQPLSLEQLCRGQLPLVDLTWPLNENNAYWPGENDHPFRLKTLATLERDGVLSKSFSTPEHLGTHLDAPNHFVAGTASVDRIPLRQLFAPGVMIDAAAAAAEDADFRLSRAHVEHWESRQGRIPEGAVVLLNTGWGRHWNQPVRYQSRDIHGRMHFPGFGPDAAEFLLRERRVRGLGIDTMSVDYGLSTDFPVHKILARGGAYGLENVASLDKLPPRGFYLIVAPIKIETGTGGPTRLFAILPE